MIFKGRYSKTKHTNIYLQINIFATVSLMKHLYALDKRTKDNVSTVN